MHTDSGCWLQVAAGRKGTLSIGTTSRSVGRPDGLRYGWADNAHCNLYNSGVRSVTSGRCVLDVCRKD